MAAFHERLAALSGRKFEDQSGLDKNFFKAFLPWWVAEFNAGSATWMVMECRPARMVPGESVVRLHCFDAQWRPLFTQTFPVGHRFGIGHVRLLRENPLGRDLLMIKAYCQGPFWTVEGKPTRPAFEQGIHERQFYARRGDELVMVRLEDDEGKLVHAYVTNRPLRKGPAPHRLTAQQWIARLESADPVERLTGLIWLTGGHEASVSSVRKSDRRESVEESRVYEAVRDSPRTPAVLHELEGSDNPWLRDYARFALESVYPARRVD
ncbi:MAG: hypothetical protein NTW19_12130 [Planctomycetota bacterium]|nr:hypothetical protein [Planctomycetota bacterium]